MDFLDLKDNDIFTTYLQDYSIGFYYDDFIDFLFVDDNLGKYFKFTKNLNINTQQRRITLKTNYFDNLKKLLILLYEIYSRFNKIPDINEKEEIKRIINFIKKNSGLKFEFEDELKECKSNSCLDFLKEIFKIFLNIYFFLIKLEYKNLKSLYNEFLEYLKTLQISQSKPTITPSSIPSSIPSSKPTLTPSSKPFIKSKPFFKYVVFNNFDRLKEIIQKEEYVNEYLLKLIGNFEELLDYLNIKNEYNILTILLKIYLKKKLTGEEEFELLANREVNSQYFKEMEESKLEDLIKYEIKIEIANYLNEFYIDEDIFDEFKEDYENYLKKRGGHNKPRIKKVIRKY